MIFLYTIAAVALFLFSYTQVDLSLTLSQASIFQTIQKMFQYVGFYQRPWATAWYIGLLVFFYVLYAVVLNQVAKKKLSLKTIWHIIGVITVILLFSYPAFSYDIFNYMFTAKTVLIYHKNPYEVTPLHFSGIEPWLSFMRWTHLPSAYTPFWIFLSLPAYLLGLGYFLFTMWSVKLIAAIGYIVTVYFVGKILRQKDHASEALGIAIVALNPLVIYESLVSAHNDIVMMAFAMMSIFLWVVQKKISSFFYMAVSTATKLMTIVLIPVMLFVGYRPVLFLAAMLVALGAVVTQREILPWYFVWVMPFVALLPRNKVVTIVAGTFSLGLLLRYAPYFYLGFWDPPVPTIKLWVTTVPVVLSLVFVAIKSFKK